MTYTCTHALILTYSRHITVTKYIVANIRIFHEFILQTYTHTCTYRKLILVQISHRSYRAYTCTGVPIGTIELILVLKDPDPD